MKARTISDLCHICQSSSFLLRKGHKLKDTSSSRHFVGPIECLTTWATFTSKTHFSDENRSTARCCVEYRTLCVEKLLNFPDFVFGRIFL